MQERYIAAADFGSSKIAFTVAKVDGDDVQLIYYKETPSDGIFYSYIRNPKKAAEALKTAISAAEEELQIKIMQLVVGLPRYRVDQQISSATINRSDPNSCITKEELSMLKSMALDAYPIDPDTKQIIYGAVAQSFSADEFIRASENDIVGVTAEELEGNFKIFIGSEKAVSNLDIVLNEVGIAPARRLFVPSAVAQAVLSESEKENGVALIEIGAGVSSLTIYKDRLLRHYCSIPFGAKNITTDIKFECGFNEALAENIKLAYGACLPEKLHSLGDKILQINDDENGTYEQLPVKYLSEIITCRSKEIIEALLFQIQDSGYADQLRNGIVLTGGGAELVNLNSLVKEMSGYTVRIGYPRVQLFSATGCPQATDPSAAAAVGMILEAHKDSHLNCIDKLPEAPKADAPSPEVQDYSEKAEGTLFDEEEGGVINPADVGKKKKKKSENKITWTNKIKRSVGKTLESTFDHTVGSLFDSME